MLFLLILVSWIFAVVYKTERFLVNSPTKCEHFPVLMLFTSPQILSHGPITKGLEHTLQAIGVQLIPYVRLAYQRSVCQPYFLFTKGPCLVLIIVELQPEHVQDITNGFTLDLIDLIGTGRFMQFFKNTIDGIKVNTSHTLHGIVPYCRYHTESPTSNRVVVIQFSLPLFPL